MEIGLHFEKNYDEINNEKVRDIRSRLEPSFSENFNEEVVFEENWTNRKWARISLVHSTGSINETLFNWAVENMKLFYEKLINEI